jgi:hypothetical protein
MYTVIDTIKISKTLMERIPDAAARYKEEGLLVILDPSETRGIQPPDDATATIERPDGSSLELPIDIAHESHTVLGLFFIGATQEQIPSGSVIEWQTRK